MKRTLYKVSVLHSFADCCSNIYCAISSSIKQNPVGVRYMAWAVECRSLITYSKQFHDKMVEEQSGLLTMMELLSMGI